jgi:hypothetical protein
MANSESVRLRLEDDEFADELTRQPAPGGQGCPCLIVETATETTYPTVAGKFFHCKIVSVLGTETEGTSASYTTAAATLKAFNLGGSIPPVGTKVIAFFVPWRWCFRYP